MREAVQGVSSFVSNKTVPWIENVRGNPTQHSSVSAVIKEAADCDLVLIQAMTREPTKRSYLLEVMRSTDEDFLNNK